MKNSLPYKGYKTIVFIDGANLLPMCQTLNLKIDFEKFRTVFEENYDLLKIIYYMPNNNISINFLNWLDYNGFCIKTKEIKKYTSKEGIKSKADMDIYIAVDMLRMCKVYEHAILISGDGDFTPLVRAIQDTGKVVTILSSERSKMLSDELRRQGDKFIDFENKFIFNDNIKIEKN